MPDEPILGILNFSARIVVDGFLPATEVDKAKCCLR